MVRRNQPCETFGGRAKSVSDSGNSNYKVSEMGKKLIARQTEKKKKPV